MGILSIAVTVSCLSAIQVSQYLDFEIPADVSRHPSVTCDEFVSDRTRHYIFMFVRGLVDQRRSGSTVFQVQRSEGVHVAIPRRICGAGGLDFIDVGLDL